MMMSDPLVEFFNLAMDRHLEVPCHWEDWGIVTQEESPLILNVGAGNKLIPGTTVLDLPRWNADTDPIPFDDATVSGIHAYHFLEHVHRPADVLWEFQRVLKVHGFVNICVPYYNAQCQAQDLDHKHAFCEETWRNLFVNPYYSRRWDARGPWQFLIRTNVIMGLVERNLVLLTQLIKVERESTQ